MQPDQYQEPQPSHRGVAWLNGITWAIVTVCFLLTATAEGYGGLPALFIMLLAAGLGAVTNLVMCLGPYATDRGPQAAPYLIGFLPPALLDWWLWDAFGHIGKIGG